MAHLVVGDKECSYYLAAKTLSKKSEVHVAKEWQNLAGELTVPDFEVNKLKTDLLLDKVTTNDAVIRILQLWRMKMGKTATLSVLIDKLRILNWTNSIEQLFRQFKIELPILSSDASHEVMQVDLVDLKALSVSNEDQLMPAGLFGGKMKIEIKDTKIHYCPENLLGKGASSEVYEGHDPFYKKVAVKIVKMEHNDTYQRELNVCQRAREEFPGETVNIVQFYYATEVQDIGYFLVMEFAKMDLMKRLELAPSKEQVRDFLHDTAKGLNWLHVNKFTHRDIKPENFLIFESASGKEIAKLTDFGISRERSPYNATTSMTSARGTEYWMAPEVHDAFRDEEMLKPSEPHDIYSLGKVFNFAWATVIAGRVEFVGIKELSNDETSANNLFQSMMHKDPVLRPTINDVLIHPFFWETEKSFNFLVDIANSSKDNPDWKTLWEKISVAYRKYYEDKYKAKFNWKNQIDGNIFFRLNRAGKWVDKNGDYQDDSLQYFVKLIRDKSQHFGDLHLDLKKTLLFYEKRGNDVAFVKSKYVNYFLKKFPDIVVILFSVLMQYKDQAYMGETLKYFQETKNFHCRDSSVMQFLKFFNEATGK